jgi:hypothetical protein
MHKKIYSHIQLQTSGLHSSNQTGPWLGNAQFGQSRDAKNRARRSDEKGLFPTRARRTRYGRRPLLGLCAGRFRTKNQCMRGVIAYSTTFHGSADYAGRRDDMALTPTIHDLQFQSQLTGSAPRPGRRTMV